jgi:hypothetical protein
MAIELTTLTMIFDGIDFIVTMIYLKRGIKMYSEIQRKLNFVNVIQKYDKTGSIKVLKKTHNIVSGLKTKQQPKKKSKDNIMMRLYSYLMDRLEARHVARIEKRERKQAKFQMRLDKHHKMKHDKKDKADEVILCAKGNERCPHCLHYTSPEILLIDLATKAGEKAVLLQMTPEQVTRLKKLILCEDKHMPSKVEDFSEFYKVFYHLQIACRECRVMFDKSWKPVDIIELHSQRASQQTVTLQDSYDFVK